MPLEFTPLYLVNNLECPPTPMLLNHHHNGSPAWVEYLPQHAIPATPEDYTGRFRYQSL
jgi:hypothetical protein